MRFDFDDPQREFSTDLFGFNPWAFAYHLEPEGFREIERLRGPRLEHYEKYVPRTFGIANGMFERIRQRREWGTQIGPSRWTFERSGYEISTGKGVRIGRPIDERDLLKHLTGRSGYARATTDWPLRDFDFDGIRSRPNFVPCLRIDIDIDYWWLLENAEMVLRELRSQKRVIEAAGLPYRVFRTGGRGVQVVIPLPMGVPPSFASLLMHGIRSALETRGERYSQPDKDNLQGLMRLPGGIHASTGDLGLWIDVDGGSLFPLEVQADMMVYAWRYPAAEEGILDQQVFKSSGRQMLVRMDANGFANHILLKREQAVELLDFDPENALSQAIANAHAEADVIRTERKSLHPSTGLDYATDDQFPPETANSPPIEDGGEDDEIPTVIGDPTASFGTVEWAKYIWDEEFEPGSHWEWLNMGGRKGILAAVILFGSAGAEQKLIELARKIRARSDYELREREFTIRALWKSFGWKEFKPFVVGQRMETPLILGELDSRVEDLAGNIVAEMKRVQPKPRWSPELANKIALMILIGIRDSDTGRLRASFGTIADSINERWPKAPTNRQRVSEMIPRMCQSKGSLVKAFYRIRGNRWASEPDEYGCGAFLRGSDLHDQSLVKLRDLAERELAELEEELAEEKPLQGPVQNQEEAFDSKLSIDLFD